MHGKLLLRISAVAVYFIVDARVIIVDARAIIVDARAISCK